MDAIGFGALNLDKIIYVDKIPKPDEECGIKSIQTFPGGSAANTVAGLAKLGLKTGYIGKVGSDAEGTSLIESMIYHGVDIKNIKVCEGKSGVCIALVDENGNRALLVDPGVNDSISMDDINIDHVAKAKFLHLTSFICKESRRSFETQKRLAKKLAGMGVKITFDPGQLYAEKGIDELREIIENSYAILPSENEIKLITGLDYRQGAELLLSEGAKVVAVKRGRKGCFVSDGKNEFDIPAYKTDVADTTGAGDAFDAGFLYGLINNKNLKDCGRLGNKVASFCIRKSGARPGLPNPEELKRAIL